MRPAGSQFHEVHARSHACARSNRSGCHTARLRHGILRRRRITPSDPACDLDVILISARRSSRMCLVQLVRIWGLNAVLAFKNSGYHSYELNVLRVRKINSIASLRHHHHCLVTGLSWWALHGVNWRNLAKRSRSDCGGWPWRSFRHFRLGIKAIAGLDIRR